MTVYPRTGRSPEALVNMLITVIEKTPGGGATLEDIREAYRYVKEIEPTDRTVYRNIRRINDLFHPHIYSNKRAKGTAAKAKDDCQPAMKAMPLTIKSERDKAGKMRYFYNGRLAVSNAESSQALMIVLGLYSQQKGILRDHFEKVIGSLLQQIISRKHNEDFFFSEAEKHIYVSGHGSANPKLIIRRISEIIRAIDNCRVLKIEYARTHDGGLSKREVEPYGLVCRHSNWYLVGFCRSQQARRIYLLDQVKRLEVMESSTFRRPPGFSIKDVFGHAWGIWNVEDDKLGEIETVRLKVAKGVAERFSAVSFHDSQKVKPMADGEAEVTFAVTGAGEMIPWLMSWGPTVQVLEPGWLKEMMVTNLAETMNVYTDEVQ